MWRPQAACSPSWHRSSPACRSSGRQVRKAPTNASKKTSSAFLATCRVNRMETGPACDDLGRWERSLNGCPTWASPFCLHTLHADRHPTALPGAPPSCRARCNREAGHVSRCTCLQLVAAAMTNTQATCADWTQLTQTPHPDTCLLQAGPHYRHLHQSARASSEH